MIREEQGTIQNVDCPKLKDKYPDKRANLQVKIINGKYVEPKECDNKQFCGAIFDTMTFNKYECHFWTINDELLNLSKEQNLVE